jgi:hypothetical protein
MFGAVGAVGFPEFEPEEPHPVKDTPRPVRMRVETYILVRIPKAGSLLDNLPESTIQIRDIHILPYPRGARPRGQSDKRSEPRILGEVIGAFERGHMHHSESADKFPV